MSLRCEPIGAPSLRSGAPSLRCDRHGSRAKSLKSQHLAPPQLAAPNRTLPTAKSLKSQHLAATHLPPPPKGGKEGPAGGRPSPPCFQSSQGVH